MTANTPLNPLAFPLHGTRLIEASAGTGKTYTIAALYARLILGHGPDQSVRGRELFPPDILVVTFTEAATKELRDRIRSRLSQAAHYFSQLPEDRPKDNDEFLEQLRASYLADEWPRCAHRLKLAADWMDEAAIYTIHGWCNRLLQQHAFDSGGLFRQEVDNDDQELLHEVVRDYWRSFFYPLTETQCLAVYKLAATPEALTKLIKPLLSETEAQGLEDDEDNLINALESWENWEQERRNLEYQAQLSWHEHKEDIEQCLMAAVENRWLNGNQYKPANLNTKLEAVALWAQGGLFLEIDALEKFSQQKLVEGLVKAHKDKADPIRHLAFLAIDNLVQHTNQESDIGKKLKLHALNWIRIRYDNV
jgi:exodeoxyribonuclease V beta subunit